MQVPIQRQTAYTMSILFSMARDRGQEAVAPMLEDECKKRGRVPRNNTHSPIHYFARRGEIGNVRAYLDADPSLIELGDKDGATPLHCAAECGRGDVVTLLLDRGANI